MQEFQQVKILRPINKVDAAKNKNSGRKGIEYEFDSKGAYGSEYSKFVQDHYQGHNYMDGTIDNTPHFNIHQRKGCCGFWTFLQ